MKQWKENIKFKKKRNKLTGKLQIGNLDLGASRESLLHLSDLRRMYSNRSYVVALVEDTRHWRAAHLDHLIGGQVPDAPAEIAGRKGFMSLHLQRILHVIRMRSVSVVVQNAQLRRAAHSSLSPHHFEHQRTLGAFELGLVDFTALDYFALKGKLLL